LQSRTEVEPRGSNSDRPRFDHLAHAKPRRREVRVRAFAALLRELRGFA
jgi:hypothetical protein